MMKKLIYIIYFLFIQQTNVWAQQMLTVEQAIATALENNYSIQLLKNDSSSFALDNSYAKAAFLPRLNATSNLQFNNNNQSQTFLDVQKEKGIM